MRKKFYLACSCTMGGLLFLCSIALAQDLSRDHLVHIAVEEGLKERTLHSGTLDLYDEAIDKVRNLRMVEKLDDVTELDGKYYVLMDYRDINSGDIVKIEVEVSQIDDDFMIGKLQIKNVQKLNDGKAPEAKDYTDEEIQRAMKDYLDKQTKFNDGKLMLFDKDAERMRNLEFIELKKEVRRLGIFISSSCQFKDVDSGEILDVDISVENKDGRITVQALRIRNVRKESGSD